LNNVNEDIRVLASTLNSAVNNQGAMFYRMSAIAGSLARDERDRIVGRYLNDNNRLENSGYRVYSQHEEDGILAVIMERLGVESGTFIEIGVEDGLECNSRLLLQEGWGGMWIEGNAEKVQAASATFASYVGSGTLKIENSFVKASNINDLINTLQLERLELLSIDIDGNDYYIWEELEATPFVVVVEYNAKFPPPIRVVQRYNENWVWDHVTDDYGASLQALVDLGTKKGYTLVCCSITGVNAFFVRDDLMRHFSKYETRDLYHPCRHHLIGSQFIGAGHAPGTMIFERV
jgi:hypothetical protein